MNADQLSNLNDYEISEGRRPLRSTLRLIINRPLVYALATPLLTLAGAATTFAVPLMLTPAGYIQYLLLTSIFQYLTDFDFGLSRMADRQLAFGQVDDKIIIDMLILARLYAAAIIAVVVIIASLFTGYMVALAGLAGVAFMVSTGPVTVYRARSNVARFTISALILQFGLSLPRFIGLLVAGVPGCMCALGGWYTLTLGLNFRFLQQLRYRPVRQIFKLFTASLPLCAFGSLWLLYLLANRWLSYWLSSPHEAGLFAFGANFVTIGLGIIGTVAQAYYPRHLAGQRQFELLRETLVLALLTTMASIIGMILFRFLLKAIFPNYVEAITVGPTLLITAIPLCICSWLMPMIIARSQQPLREAVIVLGGNLLFLMASMAIGSHVMGIVGQGIACIPSALILLGCLLVLITRNGFLNKRYATILFCVVASLVSINAGITWIGLR